ncbi:hypothetical protein EJ04DRAFT_531470 [Polyplosphaeria fusca]|uniref:Mucoidy inhibitor-like protein n=1 Tax=Polyplosphaeria fusca TaxID=682080 RepID=A0A9P4RBK0_9PLEO|nr:hypothetical protein EJ04DRAFT_531470 [Polyplosphaeria fusca]
MDASMPADASRQVFNIKDLNTKSVVLYPTRAHVTRQIDNVMLKPGANEVEIYGLSPTVDEHSIQIEGQGAASIVDLTVQLIPNRDIFEEIYPDDSESADSDDDEKDFSDSDDEKDAVASISKELKVLRLQVAESTEIQNSATERLSTLDRYTKSVTAEHNSPEEISKLLERYSRDRDEVFKVHSAATQKLTGLKKQIKRKEHEKERAGKERKKEKQSIAKQKMKERRYKDLQRAEKSKEAKYLKQERLRYWPKKIYKVTLLLEHTALETPGSSRRNSVNSVDTLTVLSPVSKGGKATDADSTTSMTPVNLLLSYVSKEAGWSPRYDLRISSLQKTAHIVYRTEFLNRTSETWKDAKISFSTSQTSYQGLDDVVPFMHAWHIKLSRYDSGDGGLLSPEEASKDRTGKPTLDTFNRADLFGLDDNFIPAFQSTRPLKVQQGSNTGGLFGKGAGGFGSSKNNVQTSYGSANNANVTSSLFSSHSGAHTAPSGPPPGAQITEDRIQANLSLDNGIMMARRASKPGASLFRGRKKESSNDTGKQYETYDPTIEDSRSIAEETDPIEFEESSWEDNGLTATYDVPGTRTIPPSSMTRRHKIASLNASNIHLSHICVPKLRSAAFLRAKIRNPSSTVTLLKGSAGVTLDGSFLGNMNLPRVSPGQIFDLPLGVDPAIHINYPKPGVHRSTQGIIFNKESAQVFSRSIWLNNTKPMPVELLVLDQIPVSEDERLRIVITTPRGLGKEGDTVRAGVSAKEGSSGAVATTSEKSTAWGSAAAKLKKNGEVDWTVKLEKGQGCLLKLEYEARLPPSERIIPA